MTARQHHNRHLQTLWSTDGAHAFKFEVVELLPLNLSVLDRQRWLAGRELEIYKQYRLKSLALNIALPQIVETPAALADFEIEEKARIKSENREISESLKAPKAELIIAGREAHRPRIQLQRIESEVAALRVLILRNSGWRQFLLGRSTGKSSAELQNDLEAASAAFRKAKAASDLADNAARVLVDKRKSLYGSYAKNIDRRRCRIEFQLDFLSGRGPIRRTRIR